MWREKAASGAVAEAERCGERRGGAELRCCPGDGEAKRGREWWSEEERGSAAAKAGGAGRDGAGRRGRAASSPAHGRHAAVVA